MRSAGAAPIRQAVRALRALVGVGFILIVATCRTGMEPQVHLAPIAVAPIMPSDAMLASFGLAIDRVRFVVVRPSAPPDTLVDTTVALPPDSATLDLALAVPLIAAAETLQVSIIALSGTIALFEGTAPVEVTTSTPTEATEIPVTNYVGPGAGVDSIAIAPPGPSLFFNDSLRFQVEAFQAGVPVTQFYVSWTTSDTTIAKVNGAGLLRAPAQRTSVRVIAHTPGGVASDSTTATFLPKPNQLLIIAGGGQTGAAGQPLPTQLEVEVRAADNLPVPGVDVRFRSLSGGGPDTIVASDAQGRARVTAVLGATPGVQQFQASLPDFPSVPFAGFSMTATGVVISPATSIVTVASPSVVSGSTVKLRLQGKDASGSDITTGGANVVFTRSGGGSTGFISATADSGNGVYTAVFTGVLAGSATTIGATINGVAVTTALPTIAVSPGAISPSGSVITIANDTVVSGDSIMLRLQARDAAGNNVTAGGATVVFSHASGTSTGAIGATADSGNGIYTAMLTGVLAGTATQIGATIDGAAVTTTHPSLFVIPGAPAQLAFLTTLTFATTGVVITPPVQVAARDLAGNATPAFTGAVTVGIGTNPASGLLAGTLTQNAVLGVATFGDLAIDQPGVGYTLTASATGLASGSTATFDLIAPGGSIFWSNAAGGNWSNPANWSGGAVPGPTETAVISLPGTYTVTLDVGDTIAGLQVGGSSGVQTLVAASKTLHVSGTTQVNPNGLLWLKASTLDGGVLSNGGKVFTEGSTSITTALVNTPSSLLRLQGNGIYSTATTTVASGFTNAGTIVLTDSNSSYGATLNVPSGTLTNAPTGTISSAAGTLGPRTIAAQLDNQGMFTLSRSLTLSRASAAHTNSGSIILAGAVLSINQSGTLPSFTNTGLIDGGAGDSVKVSAGAFNYNGGSITGGTLFLSAVTASASQSFSTASAELGLVNTSWGGTGTLTVAPATTLLWRVSTISAPLSNQGTLVVNGNSAFNGPFNNVSGGALKLQGNGIYSTATLTVANSFRNDGAIVLTDTNSSYGAVLNMPAGTTLTNAAGGTIDIALGSNGPRTLGTELNNQGTLTLHHSVTLTRSGAMHANIGTIDLQAGNLLVNQSGTSPSFSNTGGTITMGAADSIQISSGAFSWNGGSITSGTIGFTSTAVTLAQDFSTATAGLSLTGTSWSGAGILTIAPATVVVWRASSISAPLVNQGTLIINGNSAFNGSFNNDAGATLQVQGNGIYSTATLTVANSFTNNGAIELTDVTSSYGAVLNMPAGTTLTNAPGGTIDALVGLAGPRTLGLELNNQGTLTLHRDLTLSRAGAAHANSGTIDLVSGDLSINQSGTSPTFMNTGAITIAAADSVKVSSGTFNYAGGSISGGTFALSAAAMNATQNFSTQTAALSLSSSTWGGSGTLTVAPATSLLVRASTINSSLDNQGSLIVNGTSAFNGAVTTAAGTLLRVEGNGIYSTGTLTVASGFTNNGLLELTDATSSYGAILNVTAGTLVNAASGTISSLAGTLGPRTLNAQIDNQGTITVAAAANQGLTINKASASHQNSGTITISSGDLVVSGTGQSFTNTGSISAAAGDTLRFLAGSFTHNGGSISGAGALQLSSTNGTFNVAHAIASMVITSSTATFATPQNTGSTGFVFSSATINGPGLLTNDPGRFLNVRSSTINADLDNQGTLLVNGTSNFNGALTTAGTSSIRVQGNGTFSTATMNVLNGFTNNGAITLTDTTSSYGAILNVTNGTLVNADTASITALPGALGPRTIGAALDNRGVMTVALNANQALTLAKPGADHLNSGTIDLTGGDLTINQSGTTPSFTTSGTVNIGAGDTLTVNSGAFRYNGTALGGAGALVLSSVNPAAFNAAHTVATMNVTSSTANFATPQSTGATGFTFTSATINGPGSLTNDLGKTLALRGTTVNTPVDNQGTLIVNGTSALNDTLTTGTSALLRIQGNGTYSSASLAVPKGFENSGTVVLTDTTSSYGATLTVANGSLVNLPGAAINALAGAAGPRTLGAALDNRGTLSVTLGAGRELVLNRANSAISNSGTIDVSGGNLSINQSGTGAFTNGGAIALGAGDTLTVSGTTFGYVGGSLDGPGGTLVLSSNTATFSKPLDLGTIVMTSSTASFAADDSTASTTFLLTSSTLNGSGTLTNSPGKTLNIRGSSIGAPLINQGLLLVNGTSSITGPLTTVSGSTVRVQGSGTYSSASLTVNNGLVNNGAIELTDTTSTYGATLVVKTLPLVNAAGATIDVQAGANGPRTIDAMLDNKGTITVNRDATITGTSPAHTNTGTIKVSGGNLTFAPNGANPTFTNLASGGIDIGTGRTLRFTTGAVSNAAGGRINGFGTLDVRPPASFANDGDLFPGTSPGALTINAGTGTVQFPNTTASLNVEIGGTVAGTQYDQLVVTGSASWNGTLNVTLINGFTPTSTQQFVLATCSVTCSNRFGVVNVPNPFNAGSVTYVGNQVLLTAP